MIHLKAGPLALLKEDLYQHIPEFIEALAGFARRERLAYDLIHSHYWLSGSIGLEISRRWQAPHIATFHTLARTKMQARPGEQEVEQRAGVEKAVMDGVDAIVVSTAIERDEIAELYCAPRSKAVVIPPGVDLDLFKPADKTAARRELGLQDGPIVLYVGRIEPLKGIDILLQALALPDCAANARLIIVGGDQENDAEQRRLQALATELDIADRVTFTGSVEQRAPARLLQRRRRAGAAVLLRKLWPSRAGGYGVRHARCGFARGRLADVH